LLCDIPRGYGMASDSDYDQVFGVQSITPVMH
jgi:hypothetical protein